MTVYVTVKTFQGVLDNVRAYLTEESALNAEQNWLRETDITSPESREGKSNNEKKHQSRLGEERPH